MLQCNPMPIQGNWEQGYVLDYHVLRSEFVGYDEYGHPRFENTHSEIGELLYRLKYKLDKTVIEEIAEVAANFIAGRKHKIDLIAPVPPTRKRDFQPVFEVAKHIGLKLQMVSCEDCFIKIKETPELKNVEDYQQRLQLLDGAYICDPIRLRGKSMLLFDDLFRSGATLRALTQVAYQQGEAAQVFALALTRTKTKRGTIILKGRKDL